MTKTRKYSVLFTTKTYQTEQVYDGSYCGKTVVSNSAVTTTVKDFDTKEAADEAVEVINAKKSAYRYASQTVAEKLYKEEK